MNPRTAIAGAVLIVAAVLALILLGGGGGQSATSDAGRVPTVVVGRDGKPVGGVAHLTYRHGQTVHFLVRSAVADEVHVHGYDVMKDVKAGGTVGFEFPADIEGIFEAELEGRGEQIAELEVEP